jgi:hypothetical protein
MPRKLSLSSIKPIVFINCVFKDTKKQAFYDKNALFRLLIDLDKNLLFECIDQYPLTNQLLTPLISVINYASDNMHLRVLR